MIRMKDHTLPGSCGVSTLCVRNNVGVFFDIQRVVARLGTGFCYMVVEDTADKWELLDEILAESKGSIVVKEALPNNRYLMGLDLRPV